MAGFGEAAMPPAQAQTASAPAPQAPVDEEGREQATPEEQALYDNVVARCYMLIGDEKTGKPRPEIVEQLKSGEPKQALGETAAQVLFRVEQVAHDAGQDIPGDVKLNAGAEVFSTLAQIATRAGIGDFSDPNSDDYKGAFILAANSLQQLEKQGGLENPEETSAAFDQILQEDRSGQLAALMGGQGAPANG